MLDEPNANLDADGENALTRAIQILRHNKCIVIVISHRPSALAALDMAMVLYQGKAIAFGPREEIFARVRTTTRQSRGGKTACGGKTTSGGAGRESRAKSEFGAPRCAGRECPAMRMEDGARPGGQAPPRWAGELHGDGVGPQGAALILELQRLRQAFEQEEPKEANRPRAPQARRPAGEGPHPAARQRTHQPKRRRKGKMGRAIDVCLEQFGFTAAVPSARGSESARDRRSAAATPHGPIIAPDDPSLINVTRPASDLPEPMTNISRWMSKTRD